MYLVDSPLKERGSNLDQDTENQDHLNYHTISDLHTFHYLLFHALVFSGRELSNKNSVNGLVLGQSPCNFES